MLSSTRTLRWSALAALQDFRVVYTIPTWTLGWLLRCICQVAVFALLGRYVGAADLEAFLLVGTAVLVGLASVSIVVQAAAWERRTGTLPLLVASPGSPFVVFVGRGTVWLLDGLLVSTLVLLIVPSLVGQAIDPLRVLCAVPLLGLTYLGAFFFAQTAAALTLDAPGARNLVSNLSAALVALLCGIQVPLEAWPSWVGAIAMVLPVTHGVVVVRSVVVDGSLDVGALLAQVAVTVAWAVVAAVTFGQFLRRARRSGRIEFGE
ncbi:hypothetical protein CTE05_19130 [Cellulomonas terrae]|uniref:ABC-2 type transporter transmembrane domain-containing protein n=1 Tax=Cellulomonas terrae TaxID=311234 RepID=A0A511JK87_9CELL|nr:hypothetical protein CTE05_19130 [Cellulomonas terrae]